MYKASDVKSKYGYDPMPLDLSRIPDWERFVQAMNYAMMKQFSALEKGGRMAVLMGDIKKKGKLYSMIAEIVKPGTMENIIIKAQHNCFSDNTQYSGNVIKLRNIEKSQIEKYGIFLLKSVDNSHDLCGRFYQILRSGR